MHSTFTATDRPETQQLIRTHTAYTYYVLLLYDILLLLT